MEEFGQDYPAQRVAQTESPLNRPRATGEPPKNPERMPRHASETNTCVRPAPRPRNTARHTEVQPMSRPHQLSLMSSPRPLCALRDSAVNSLTTHDTLPQPARMCPNVPQPATPPNRQNEATRHSGSPPTPHVSRTHVSHPTRPAAPLRRTTQSPDHRRPSFPSPPPPPTIKSRRLNSGL